MKTVPGTVVQVVVEHEKVGIEERSASSHQVEASVTNMPCSIDGQ
jgi:hypothetical protein